MLLYSVSQMVFKVTVTQRRRELKVTASLVSKYFRTVQNIILFHLKSVVLVQNPYGNLTIRLPLESAESTNSGLTQLS